MSNIESISSDTSLLIKGIIFFFKNIFNSQQGKDGNKKLKNYILGVMASLIEIIQKQPLVVGNQDVTNIEIINEYIHKLFYNEIIEKFINKETIVLDEVSIKLYNLIFDLIFELSKIPLSFLKLVKNSITLELLLFCLKSKRFTKDVEETKAVIKYDIDVFNNFALKVFYYDYCLRVQVF